MHDIWEFPLGLGLRIWDQGGDLGMGSGIGMGIRDGNFGIRGHLLGEAAHHGQVGAALPAPLPCPLPAQPRQREIITIPREIFPFPGIRPAREHCGNHPGKEKSPRSWDSGILSPGIPQVLGYWEYLEGKNSGSVGNFGTYGRNPNWKNSTPVSPGGVWRKWRKLGGEKRGKNS